VTILDVGGLPSFWATVGHAADQCDIVVVNNEAGQYSTAAENSEHPENMAFVVGDACDLAFEDDEFDLVVCNAVLEHVGDWKHVTAAARELRRVGRHGWVEVPAFEFPLEVHYMRPAVHWLAEPLRAKALRLTSRRVRAMSTREVREMFDYVRLMTRREFMSLFPDDVVTSERFLGMRKAHIARW
jgi:ubiquinone/menaquinone biosynthesis C-methylase UbiE